MDLTVTAIVIMAVGILVPLILGIVGSTSQIDRKTPNVIQHKTFFLVVGVADLALLVFAVTMIALQGLDGNIAAMIFAVVAFVVISCIGGWLILNSINFKLLMGEECLVYRNMWGITRRYEYSEISRIRLHYFKNSTRPEKYKIYIGERVITIDYLMENFAVFEKIIKKRLKEAKNSIKIEAVNA